MRKNISTVSPTEKRVGYSRAVRMDNRMYFSGTTAVDERGNIVGKTLYEQAVFIFDKIKKVLEQEGFGETDIVGTTVYVTSMKNLPDFDKAFHERFAEINPTCTLVGVSELFDPAILIEIECVAEK